MAEGTAETTATPSGTQVRQAAAARLRSRALRIRYAGLGLVMAVLWVGHAGEPAWLHAVRLLLVLLTIAPLLALTRRYRERHVQASAQRHPDASLYWLIGTRIAAVGIALGVGWLLSHLLVPHHSDTPKLIILRIGLLAISVPVQLKFERERQAAGHPPRVAVKSPRLIAAKLLLVVLALGAQWLLGIWTPDAELIVAPLLFGTVALAGPKVHRYLVSPSRAADRPTATDPANQPDQTAGPSDDPRETQSPMRT
jgi:hypothetical protein